MSKALSGRAVRADDFDAVGFSESWRSRHQVDGEKALKLYFPTRDTCSKYEFEFLSEVSAIWRSTNYRQMLPISSDRSDSAHRASACARALIQAHPEVGHKGYVK